MKRSLYILISFLFFACAGGDNSQEETHDEETTTTDNLDEEIIEEETEKAEIPEGFEGSTFTVKAAVDGPEGWLYIVPPQYEVEYDVLKIIPDDYDYEVGEIKDWMTGLLEMDFELYGFEGFSGGVLVYYDSDEEHLMSAFYVSNGKPNGKVTLFDVNGQSALSRTYENGEWVGSIKDIGCVDWTFDQANSSLTVNDGENGYLTEKDRSFLKLCETYNWEQGSDSRLYTIMEKASFNNPFKVNEVEFTGELMAFYGFNGQEPEIYYSLNFTDGWLDGEIKIYDEWGDLTLRERFEMGELVETIFQREYEDGVAKPIIYLYPEKEMDVSVRLNFNGALTHTYPQYNHGWKVHAQPDGTLWDSEGKEYYALYWEGQERHEFTIDEGFVVSGTETAKFLEVSLEMLGLNRREANEFIVYWLPRMENNPYNLIHFSSAEYERLAQLRIEPEPETLIRVMMVYQPLDEAIAVPKQDLSKLAVDRKGFTVVEWGGTQIDRPVLN